MNSADANATEKKTIIIGCQWISTGWKKCCKAPPPSRLRRTNSDTAAAAADAIELVFECFLIVQPFSLFFLCCPALPLLTFLSCQPQAPAASPLMTVHCQFTHTAIITNYSPLDYNPTHSLHLYTHVYHIHTKPRAQDGWP